MDFWEIFTLVTGVVYLLLEIRQSNLMWVVGILTGAAAVVVFMKGRLYASMGLNVYYVAVSFWGLYAWVRDSAKLASANHGADSPDASIHLGRLTPVVVIISSLLMVAGTAGLVFLLKVLGDPMSVLDAAVTVLSAIATWWLGRSFIQQWWLWLVADGMSTALCASQGMWWMTALYLFYALSAVWGYVHWRRNGVYV